VVYSVSAIDVTGTISIREGKGHELDYIGVVKDFPQAPSEDSNDTSLASFTSGEDVEDGTPLRRIHFVMEAVKVSLRFQYHLEMMFLPRKIGIRELMETWVSTRLLNYGYSHASHGFIAYYSIARAMDTLTCGPIQTWKRHGASSRSWSYISQ